MAFTAKNLTALGVAGNNKIFTYKTTDAASVVEVANYFLNAYGSLTIGDKIIANMNTITEFKEYFVSAVSSTAVTITSATTNNVSIQELTASGAVRPGVRQVELNHISVAVVATMVAPTSGSLSVKNTSASGTESHTLTLSGGTWDGTTTIVTLNAGDEFILTEFDSAGNGTTIENVGSVALS